MLQETIEGGAAFLVDLFLQLLLVFQEYQKEMKAPETKIYYFMGFGGDHAAINTGFKSGVFIRFNQENESLEIRRKG